MPDRLRTAAGLAAAIAIALLGPAARAEIVSGACPVEPEADFAVTARIDCGHVFVPMDPADPSRGEVQLAYMRARGLDKKARQPPLLMLAGGPGATMLVPTAYALFSDGFLGPILKDRDILILDERGMGYSIPVLDCAGFHRIAWTAQETGAKGEAEIALAARAVADCAAEARSAGIDLTLFNSRVMAADIEAARIAFGDDRFLVYGASYGTMLAQHYLRDFPASVEAVILDGANPLSTRSWIEDRALDFAFAMGNLDDLCRADPACAAAYDIKGMMAAGLAAFADGPIPYRYTAEDGTVLDLSLVPDDFVEFVYGQASGQIGIRGLPMILSLFTSGGRDSMGEGLGASIGDGIIASRDAVTGGLATLMHYAVVCSDDPVRSADELRLDPDTPEFARVLGMDMAQEYTAMCAALGLPELPPETDVDPVTDVPVLLLAGRLDSRTPAFYAERLAQELPNATLAEFPEGTHVQIAEINFCAATIVMAFAADPAARPDLSCISSLPKPGFLLPDGTMSNAASSPENFAP